MSTVAVASNTKSGKDTESKASNNNNKRQTRQSNNNSNSSNKQEKHHDRHPDKSQAKSEKKVASPSQGPQTHPLNRRWTLWYDSPSTYNTENWELSLLPIMTMATVEDFFVMLRYMKPLHDLRTSSQYHFFQEGVKPMWEDPANKEGGKIWVNIEIPSNPQGSDEKKSSTTAGTPPSPNSPGTFGKSELDQLWERVLMGIIGEYMEPSTDPEKKEGGSEKPQIVGVVMAKRKYHNRLALWVRDAGNSAAIEAMKKKLKEEAALPASASLVFTKHGESGGKN